MIFIDQASISQESGKYHTFFNLKLHKNITLINKLN